YTEYGTPIDPAQTAAVGTSAGYGWLGLKERSTTAETANLTLMGVRFYNRITGAFTSPDPIVGGNATSYNYPTDSVNKSDETGECQMCRRPRHDGGGFGGGFGGGGWRNSGGSAKTGYKGNTHTAKENHKSGRNVHKRYPSRSAAKREFKRLSKQTYKNKKITTRYDGNKYNVEVRTKKGKLVKNYHLYYN
ncbi:hypothetical protein M3B40_14800, partial [Brachybacterium muris]|nr:hypothetical protein [Brachybacterium muris]